MPGTGCGRGQKKKLFARYNPISTQAEALAIEEALTLELRAMGYGAYSK